MDNYSIYFQHENNRHYEKMCPYRAMWLRITEKMRPGMFGIDRNVAILSEEEKVYFAANLLKRNVRNGGLEQYFRVTDSSVENLVEPSLIRIDDKRSLALYLQAKELLFGGQNLPEWGEKREEIIYDQSKARELVELNTKFWDNIHTLDKKLRDFAFDSNLLMPAWQKWGPSS